MQYLIISVVAIFAIYVLKYYKRHFLDYRTLPGPSPWTSFPVIGHSWILGNDPIGKIFELQKQYGDVIRLDIGFLPSVILTGFEDVTELFKMEALAGRSWSLFPHMKYLFKAKTRDGNYPGVAASEGRNWVVQRKWMMSTFTKLGMSTQNGNVVEEVVTNEAESLCDILADLAKQGPVPIKKKFAPAINNVVMNLTTGAGSKQSDPKIIELTNCIARYFQTMGPSNLMCIFSMYSYVFNRLLNKVFGVETYIELNTEVIKKMSAEIDRGIPAEDGNYVDRYKFEIKKAEADPNSTFHGADGELNLFGQLLDIFIAGTDTTATFLEYAILYLIAYPDIQAKVYEELSRVVGNRKPRMEDREKLPYTQAFLEETTRYTPMGLLPPPRRTTTDVKLKNGMVIPKNTQVFNCFNTMHMNKENFNDPETFRPERFIDSKTGEFSKSEKVILFGVGKRRCPGEVLAKAEYFLFLTILIQTFQLKAAGPIDFSTVPGLGFTTVPYDVTFIPRH